MTFYDKIQKHKNLIRHFSDSKAWMKAGVYNELGKANLSAYHALNEDKYWFISKAYFEKAANYLALGMTRDRIQ